MKKTSWENVSGWYGDLVSKEGHTYHRTVIFPKLLPMIKGKQLKVLDLGCGSGPLARQLPKSAEYLGIDISKSLIAKAKVGQSDKRRFLVKDVTKPLTLDSNFTHATMILCLQNMADPLGALNNAAKALKTGGKLFVVLNHPCFRIPRQSHWGVDEAKKVQYRRMDRYLSPLEIPIQHQPSQGKRSETTLSYHNPLSTYATLFAKAGFVITDIEEWVSEKQSTGKKARMENRARKEFPLFLTWGVEKR